MVLIRILDPELIGESYECFPQKLHFAEIDMNRGLDIIL